MKITLIIHTPNLSTLSLAFESALPQHGGI